MLLIRTITIVFCLTSFPSYSQVTSLIKDENCGYIPNEETIANEGWASIICELNNDFIKNIHFYCKGNDDLYIAIGIWKQFLVGKTETLKIQFDGDKKIQQVWRILDPNTIALFDKDEAISFKQNYFNSDNLSITLGSYQAFVKFRLKNKHPKFCKPVR